MAVLTRIAGLVRGLAAGNYPEGKEEQQLAVNTRGDLIVAQGQPVLAEMVRMGNTWGVIGAVTAALTAVPTVTAGLSLWNGEAGAGKSYIIDAFGALEVVTDATQENSLALFAMVSKLGSVAAPTDAALVKSSMIGANYGGLARHVAGGTVVDNGWQPHGPTSPAGGSAFAGDVWRVTEAVVNGLYVVPPGTQFNIVCAKTVATASQIRYYMRWHEAQLAVATS